VNIQKLA